mgnify:CR=1 FL=1
MISVRGSVRFAVLWEVDPAFVRRRPLDRFVCIDPKSVKPLWTAVKKLLTGLFDASTYKIRT